MKLAPHRFSPLPTPSQALTVNALEDILNKGIAGLQPFLQISVRRRRAAPRRAPCPSPPPPQAALRSATRSLPRCRAR